MVFLEIGDRGGGDGREADAAESRHRGSIACPAYETYQNVMPRSNSRNGKNGDFYQ